MNKSKITILLIVIPLFIVLARAQDTIQVQAGWNMIGTGSTLVVSEMNSEPTGIVASEFFGYRPGIGYSRVDTLNKNKGYWVKANHDGILVWNTPVMNPCLGTPTVSYAGKVYNTVAIGAQCWLKENIDVGTMIDSLTNQTNNSTIEKYCYRNDPTNCDVYGGLYQWDEAMQYSTNSGTQGICPTGWHIPTRAQLDTLILTVNHVGNALKAIGQGEGPGAGTNTSGFSALLAGKRAMNQTFIDLGYYTDIWSSLMQNEIFAYAMPLAFADNSVNTTYTYKAYGSSVRCLKD